MNENEEVKEEKVISISDIAVMGNRIIICTDDLMDMEADDHALSIYDEEEKYSVEIEHCMQLSDTDRLIIDLPEDFLRQLSDLQYIMQQGRVILRNKKNGQRVFFRQECSTELETYISGFFNKPLYLYFSKNGELSLRNCHANEMESVHESEINLITLNENDYQLDEEILMFEVPEKYRCYAPFSLFLGKMEEEKRLSTDAILLCAGCIKYEEKYKIRINLNDIGFQNEWWNDNFWCAIQLEGKKDNEMIRFVFSHSRAREIERYTYDIRSSNQFQLLEAGGQIFLKYFSNAGLTVKKTEPELIYTEQYNNEITHIDVSEEVVQLQIRCRDADGTYTGILLKQGKHRKEISDIEYEQDIMRVSIDTGKLWEEFASGTIEIYSVLNKENGCYMIENKLNHRKAIDYVNTYQANDMETIIPQMSACGALCFQNRIAEVDEKWALCDSPELSFAQFTRQIKEGKHKASGKMIGDILSVDNNCFCVVLQTYKRIDEIAVVYRQNRTDNTIVKKCEQDPCNKRIYRAYFPDQQEYEPYKQSAAYRVLLAMSSEGKYYLLNLEGWKRQHKYIDLKSMYDRRDFFFEPIARFCIDNTRFEAIPYFAVNGNFSVNLCEYTQRYIGQLANYIDEVSIYGRELRLKASCLPLRRGVYKGFIIKYRGKISEDRVSRYVEARSITESEEGITVEAVTDIPELHLRMIYWDIFSWIEVDGDDFGVGLYCRNDELEKRYQEVENKDYFITDDENIVYPYITKTNQVAIAYRQQYPFFDSKEFKQQERQALETYCSDRQYYDKQNIILVYEKYCTAAQDNGYYFFRYCMDNHVEEEIDGHVYYVIDKSSKDYENIEKYSDHVLQFGSLEHMIALLAAKFYVSTDTKEHSYVYRVKGSVLLQEILKKDYVFLQHGVTAFKKIDQTYGKNKFGEPQKFIVTSDFERNIVLKNLKLPDGNVNITGFARWDVLQDKSSDKRNILIVPTWRTWLDDVEDVVFVSSEYFNRYMELLNDARLQALLEKYDLTCDFYLHIKFKDYISNFDTHGNARIRLNIFGERPLNEILMESRLLLTDYSSVSWDMYYQGKPVLFYQFDLDEFLYAHGSYVDMKKRLIGDRAETLEELFYYLEDYIVNGFELKPRDVQQMSNFFKYRDDQNSKRIWLVVKELFKSAYQSGTSSGNEVRTPEMKQISPEQMVRETSLGHVGLRTICNMLRVWFQYKFRRGK